MNRIYLIALAFLFLFSPSVDAQSADLAKKVSPSKIKKDLTYLSSDQLEGRKSGTAGQKKAAQYIADHFKRCGLQPIGPKKSYFQPFTLYDVQYMGKNTAVKVRRGFRQWGLKVQDDFQALTFSAQKLAMGSPVFCGYGLKTSKYDDFAKVVVKGKVAVILHPLPRSSRWKKAVAHKNQSLVRRVLNAQKAGAAGVVVLTDPGKSDLTPYGSLLLNSFQWRLFQNLSIPLVGLRKLMAMYLPGLSKMGALDTRVMLKSRYNTLRRFFSLKGRPLRLRDRSLFSQVKVPVAHAGPRLERYAFERPLLDRVQKIIQSAKPQSFAPSGNINILMNIDIRQDALPTKNVVGLRVGDDPKLKHEYIVVGAHYDHVGRIRSTFRLFSRDSIWNGADDNGSGTVAMMEMARVLSSKKVKCKRSILFIAFSGEEYGLLGAFHYVRNPLVPLDKTVAMFNLDMVGRNSTDEVYVCGTVYSNRLNQLVDRENPGFKTIRRTEMMLRRSDQFAFYQKGIPLLFFNSGLHKDYHEPSDEIDKINFPKIAKVAQFALRITYAVANDKKRPDWKLRKRKRKAPGKVKKLGK